MINIAVDGPAGAGKSYLAKQLAHRLGYIYVDTGAIYRTVGLYVREKEIAKEDVGGIISCLPDIKIELKHIDGVQHVILCGEDVGDRIRTPEMSMYASSVSAIPEVRSFLLSLQRDIAATHNVVMDGRDIGTVILPDATVKIFLTARDEIRAKRRYDELCEKGIATTLEDVLADMKARDHKDETRETAPAVAAEDAVLLDNSELDAEGTVEAALKIVEEKTR